MSVLHIEQVVEETVASQTLYKVFLGLFKIGFKVLVEEGGQIPDLGAVLRKDLLQAVEGGGVRDEFNEGGGTGSHENVVGPQIQVESCLLEYLLDSLHQLHCEHFLSEVIIRFYHERLELESAEHAVVAFLLVHHLSESPLVWKGVFESLQAIGVTHILPVQFIELRELITLPARASIELELLLFIISLLLLLLFKVRVKQQVFFGLLFLL